MHIFVYLFSGIILCFLIPKLLCDIVIGPIGERLSDRYLAETCVLFCLIHALFSFEGELDTFLPLDVIPAVHVLNIVDTYLFLAIGVFLYDTRQEFLVYDPIIGWYIPETVWI